MSIQRVKGGTTSLLIWGNLVNEGLVNLTGSTKLNSSDLPHTILFPTNLQSPHMLIHHIVTINKMSALNISGVSGSPPGGITCLLGQSNDRISSL